MYILQKRILALRLPLTNSSDSRQRHLHHAAHALAHQPPHCRRRVPQPHPRPALVHHKEPPLGLVRLHKEAVPGHAQQPRRTRLEKRRELEQAPDRLCRELRGPVRVREPKVRAQGAALGGRGASDPGTPAPLKEPGRAALVAQPLHVAGGPQLAARAHGHREQPADRLALWRARPLVLAQAGHAGTGAARVQSMRACAGFVVVADTVTGMFLLGEFRYGCLTVSGVGQCEKVIYYALFTFKHTQVPASSRARRMLTANRGPQSRFFALFHHFAYEYIQQE